MNAVLLLVVIFVVAFVGAIRIPEKVSSFTRSFIEEVEQKKSDVQLYRQDIQTKLTSSIHTLSRQQKRTFQSARNDVKRYVYICKALYKEAIQASKQKHRILESLNSQVARSEKFDESLEVFREFYSNKFKRNHIHRPRWKKVAGAFNYRVFNPIKHAADESFRRAAEFLTIDGPRHTELKIEQSLHDLAKLQDDFMHKLKKLNHTASSIFPAALSKEDVRRSREAIETQLRHLETEGNLWVEEKIKRIDSAVREWQKKLMQKERVLDDLVNQRLAAVHYTQLSDDTLNKVLDLIDPNAEGWTVVKRDHGVTVYRKLLSPGSEGAKYACVKCYGEVKASPQRVYDLLTDDARVREYNSLYGSGKLIEAVADNTRVVHCTSVAIFPFQPRDFVYVVHHRKLRDGTMVVLNRATEHARVPKQQSGCIRGTILLAAHIIQPVTGQPEHSKLTMITQVDPGGFAPPGIVNQICTLGPIGFMKNVETAANK